MAKKPEIKESGKACSKKPLSTNNIKLKYLEK